MRHHLTALLVLAAPVPALAQPEEDLPPTEAAAPAPSPVPVRAKPVPFEKEWLQPFFRGPAAHGATELIRLEDWAGAEAAFGKLVKRLPRSSPDRLPAQFLLATAQMQQSKWREAGRLFQELWSRYPLLAPYHAYNAARCALRGGDPETALIWVDRVPAATVPEAETVLVRVDALRARDRFTEVAEVTASFLERFPAGPRRAETMFRRAEALEKLGQDGLALYRRVWAEAPLEAWAERIGERPLALRASDWATRGMAFFDANRNAESEAAFTTALGMPGIEPDLECKARYHRAQSVWKQRQRPRAASLFDEAEVACTKAGNRDLHTKSLYQGARCYGSRAEYPAALARYARIEAEHADHSYADDARLRAAEIATEMADDANAAALMADIPGRYPKGDLLGEALWRLAFRAWRAGNLDEALRRLDENLRLVPRESIWYAEGRAHYWKGRVFEKQGKPEDARAAFERAVREYPLSVYALLALERMREGFPDARRALMTELREAAADDGGPKGKRRSTDRDGDDGAVWSFSPRPLFGEAGFRRAVELARMGLGGEARRELGRLGVALPDKGTKVGDGADGDDLLWIAAILLDRGGVWMASHAIPRYGLTGYRIAYPKALDGAKWRLAYPRAFPELVARNSAANQIPEALQLAIMREESAFNPRIESFANAIGLTQMLVKTARRFSNGAAVSRELLVDPARNLEVGSRFLAFLWKRYGSTAPLAIAGYNAGEGAVDRWLRERGDLGIDEFMETIPYDETRNYTKRVLASYFAYSWLYDRKNPVPAIPLTTPARKTAGGPSPTATPRTN